MIAFQGCLLKGGVNCERVDVNEYGKPIDRDKLDERVKPTLQNMSLVIGVCIRTALQEGRKIKFGQVKAAITTCPYD